LQLFIVLLDKVFEMRLMSIGFSFWMDGFLSPTFFFPVRRVESLRKISDFVIP